MAYVGLMDEWDCSALVSENLEKSFKRPLTQREFMALPPILAASHWCTVLCGDWAANHPMAECWTPFVNYHQHFDVIEEQTRILKHSLGLKEHSLVPDLA